MIRNIGAVIAGMVVGGVVNMAVVMVNAFVLFPMPPGTSFEDPEQMAAYIAGLPVIAWLIAILAHLLQAFVGGWVAARLGGSYPMVLALIVGGLSLLGGILNLIDLSAPIWMWAELPLYLGVAAVAGQIELARRLR